MRTVNITKANGQTVAYLCEKKDGSFRVTNIITGETKVYKLSYDSIVDNSEFTLTEMFIESVQQCMV